MKSKRVLVIRGSSGIGMAVATGALAEGADVTIAGRTADRLDRASGVLGNVRAVQLDTSDADGLAAFFETAEAFDHILVSAAQTPTGPLRRLGVADARAAMDSKFWGAYAVARVAKIADRGSLTFVSGFLAERPSASSVLQGAINAALEALARGLALELAPVRVNAISLGRALDRQIDGPRRLRLNPVAEPAQRSIGGERRADAGDQRVEGGVTGGALHDSLDLGAMLVMVA